MEKKYVIITPNKSYIITEEEEKRIDSRFSHGVPTTINFMNDGKQITLFVRHIISIEEL